jgi:hypothetical protein
MYNLCIPKIKLYAGLSMIILEFKIKLIWSV